MTGWPTKSLSQYIFGFSSCLLLTIIAFTLVNYMPVSKATIYALIAMLAITQMMIQAVCFLGLKADAKSQWNLLPFLFTLFIIIFLVGGSLWIMHNLSVLMMDYIS